MIEEEPVRQKTRVEKELFRLREKLWTVRGRRSRATGVAFLIISGFFLSLAYFTRYIVFEITSILALFLGVVFVFIGVEPYVKMSVASRAVTSSLIPLSRLLSHLKVEGKAIHIPATSEQGSSKIFIPKHSRGSLPSFEKIANRDDVVILGEGVLLPSVGDALLQLYEEELGDLRSIDLDYLMEWLPKVLVDELRIAESMEITQKGMEIHVKLTESAFRQVCQRTEAAKVICETTGCPLCSSIADAIAKTTGQIVYFLNCSYDPVTRETSAQYSLGPSIKTLMKKEEEEKGQQNKG